MYYHDIDFPTQASFFLISFLSGVIAGFFGLFFFSFAFSKRSSFFLNLLGCLVSTAILICSNIAFEDAALRVYECVAFLIGECSVLILLKKRSDKLLCAIKVFISRKLFKPFFRLCKHILNKEKILLKKTKEIVYNLFVKKVGAVFHLCQKQHSKVKRKRKPKSQKP